MWRRSGEGHRTNNLGWIAALLRASLVTSVLGFAEEIAARFPEPSSRCVDTYALMRALPAFW
ncbi:MAG: hypothetical protein LBO79_10705 [Zoogloeaceae bacterium]|jgi:hypothetical protein|nr:hypothetical protein [Zoogloeaceae bacterium]